MLSEVSILANPRIFLESGIDNNNISDMIEFMIEDNSF